VKEKEEMKQQQRRQKLELIGKTDILKKNANNYFVFAAYSSYSSRYDNKFNVMSRWQFLFLIFGSTASIMQ
jgi:hypothetical protein